MDSAHSKFDYVVDHQGYVDISMEYSTVAGDDLSIMTVNGGDPKGYTVVHTLIPQARY